MNVLARDATVEAVGGAAPRRERLLDAAETCFVRAGFDRTTMQDIAREAAMSPANIYRYFQSKDDVVENLAAREVERAEALVAALAATGDKRTELVGLIEACFVAATRETAVLRLEIWAETTRNSRFAAMASDHEAKFRAWFTAGLSAAAASRDCDVEGLFALASATLKGLLVNRAVLPDYDPRPAVAQLCAVLDAALSECGR